MMMTGGPSDPGRGKVYIGRTRGLRQGGGRKMKVTNTGEKKPPLGTGQRFKNLVSQLAKRPGVSNARGLAASIGRAKYGGAKMSQMAAKGRGR